MYVIVLFVRFVQCFFCWKVKLPEWSDEAQAVCACTFGRGDDSCNIAIASHVADKAYQCDVPYCVQGELTRYVKGSLRGYSSAETFDTHRKGYIGTRQTVQEQVEEYLRPQWITKIHVEAHPEHAWRVVMCYQAFSMQVVSVCAKNKPYPSKSTQVWCRNKWRFVPYEILARLHYLLKGYI